MFFRRRLTPLQSQVQSVPHAVFLRLKVLIVILVWGDLDGDILYDLQAYALGRIVGHKPHLVHAEMAQHLRPATIIALVGLEAEMHVGVNRVEPFLLQLVRLNLVHKAYAAALLLHVYQHALAFLLYHLHSLVQLLAAVATLASEDVARGA